MNYFEYSALIYFASLGLCFLLYVEWKKYRLDRFRFRLFRIRDQLFHKAAQGKISFDDEAYKIARANLNGMIRYSHDVSLLSLLLYKRVSRLRVYQERAVEYRDRVSRAQKALSPEARKCVDEAMREMHHETMTYIAFNSLPAITLVSFMFFWFLGETLVKKVKGSAKVIRMEESQPFESMSRRIDALDIEVNELGGCMA